MRRLMLATYLALVLSGCGGSDEEAGSAPEAPAAAPNTVGMKDIRFEPGQLTVKVGDTVTWVNREAVEHNVVATEGATFESEVFGQDGKFVFKAEKAGTISYVCTLHSGMGGTLTVQ